MGFCEASEQRNTHDNCVARLGHPHAQALHDQSQKMFPPSCLEIGVNEVIRVYGVIEVNGSHWRQCGIGGHWGQWGLFLSLESVGLLGSMWVIGVNWVIGVYKAPLA